MEKLQPHELSNFYPMHDNARFQELVDGMKQSGYRNEFPIVLYEGKILDGRNRYNAAVESGVKPFMVQFSGDDPVEFVVQANSHRRDLTTSQRAAIAVDVESYLSKIAKTQQGRRTDIFQKIEKSPPIRSAKEAAKQLGTNHQYVIDAKKLKENSPEMFEKVKSGGMTLRDAKKEVKKQEKKDNKSSMAKSAKDIELPDLVSLKLGDMRKLGLELPSNSVDLIVTDPPYPGEFIELWSELAKLALRVLKPSGFVFAYSGQLHLPEVFSRMSEHLVYYWTLDLLHSGNNQLIMPRNVFCGWKPILIYQKPPFKRFDESFDDTIKGSGREKSLHDWQQAESELDGIIDMFSMPGQTILDPFSGSGTTISAAARLKRKAIGFEVDETAYLLAKKRVSDAIHD